MHIWACSHAEIVQVKSKWAHGCVFMNSWIVFWWLWGTDWYPSFSGLLMGNEDELSHVSCSSVAWDVISPPCLLPLHSLQGAVKPIPSCPLKQEPSGGTGSAQRNPAVRVPGQGCSPPLPQTMKHKQLSGRPERSRRTRHPETVLFSLSGTD